MPARVALGIALITGLVLTHASLAEASDYTLYEAGQVRPLAVSPSGQLLFAVNTPDNRLEVFRITSGGLSHRASIPVGIEPVAVAARSDSEVWVVNHLSDSVSVVQLSFGSHFGRVVRTLLVGDEPRDIVFAGPGGDRAFITTAHRGQNSPIDPQLTTAGVGRADVWVFDAGDLGSSLGGDPLTIVTLFSDTPRALAVSPDRTRVYAAAFKSGNRTAAVPESLVPNGFEANGGAPGPATNFEGVPAPEVGLIVQHDGTDWRDEIGREWNDAIKFSLPDRDVFVLDAVANPPAQLPGPGGALSGVGTIIYNMAVNPVTGKVYVSNTEALNLQSFEGPGIFAGRSLRGHLHESRITVLDGTSVTPRHLNKHIDYGVCCAPTPNAETARSLALPQSIAVTADGQTVYVAALGSAKIGVLSAAELENDTFVPDPADHIAVSGGGPTGIVLGPGGQRLYALTRFDNSISIIDTALATEVGHVAMFNPEPPSVTVGRRFLYDATASSSHGDSACASCHVFGDFDGLAWNLGNPDAPVIDNPGPFGTPLIDLLTGQPIVPEFHPLKGPMTTQSLRGMANHGPMHWRGDRTGGNDAASAQPDSGTFDERAAFEKFQFGFINLLGRHAPIPDADMAAFTDFILQVTYPPNPIRNLDDSLTAEQAAGEDFFFNVVSDPASQTSCGGCHITDANGNPGSAAPGFFGTIGRSTFDFEPQLFKVPHLRNLYQKVGMFGRANTPGIFPGNNDHQGDQIRGFGYIHDGTFDTIFRFESSFGFSNLFPGNVDGIPFTPAGDQIRREVQSFVFAYPSNLAPVVGQQVTLGHGGLAVASPRINLLIARAEEGECDLVVKTRLLGQDLGFLYVGDGKLLDNRASTPLVPEIVIRLLAHLTGLEFTYTCAPPGSGTRIALDRDGDGFLDGDEYDAGSDPADPGSTP